MKTILVYIWRVWFVVLGLVLTILVAPFAYFLFLSERYTMWGYKMIRFWCLGMFYGMGFRYELIKQTEKKIDPSKQYIIIANHTSMIDVMLPCILHPKHPICYVGKKELEKIPVFGAIYKKIFVSVDRKDPKSRAEVYVKCAQRIKEGKSIAIFPEGGVPDDTTIILDEFKNGAFSMAEEHNIDIIVYTFVGLKEMFPFDNKKGYPGRVKVYFNDILHPVGSMEALKKGAREIILQTLLKETLEQKFGGSESPLTTSFSTEEKENDKE